MLRVTARLLGSRRLLGSVGLDGFERRPLAALSGGQLQRVLLLHAIDPPPALLLLDEPAAGLDTESQELLEQAVQRVRRQSGTALLMVSHDPAQVARMEAAVTELAPPQGRS